MINLKSKVIVISKRKYLIIFSLAFVFLVILMFRKNNVEYNNVIQKNTITTFYNGQTSDIQISKEENEMTNINKLEIKEIEGTEVIGKLEIPKIDLVTYILSDTSKETLNKSVTKLCGPKVNGVGNLCITGHNYHNDRMFGDLKDLDIKDKIYITGTKGDKIEYVVYEIDKVYPKEIECLSQETGGERQITLITCTTGAIKRLIVKATEVYD